MPRVLVEREPSERLAEEGMRTVEEFKARFPDAARDIERMAEGDEQILEANGFVRVVAEHLGLPPPLVAWGFVNKHYARPRFRGMYDPKDNVIWIAVDYPFRGEEDVARAIRHEISEWLEAACLGVKVHRLLSPHREDRVFQKIQRIVRETYPGAPEELAERIAMLRGRMRREDNLRKIQE